LQACPHEVAGQILKIRELNKANKTFIDSILRYEHNGRIHCEFNQLKTDDGGTVTGRFSSSNPNLQQIPARDPELKSAIRGLFVPEGGEKWGSFDYSSQEPRLLVHYCSMLSDHNPSPAVDEIVAAYQQGDVDFHQMVADMAGISRKQAKTVNLGIMYGMGRGKLANTLDITQDEAKELLDTYHSKVPFVKGLADMVSTRASKHGQVRTLLGRKCRFDMWEPNSFGYNKPLPHEEAVKEYGPGIRRAFTYKALNKLIQGSAADQTKKAMADCFAEGLIPLLTVHDELCFSISSEDQASRIKEIMETCVPLRVPSKVDQELGENWGEVG
jgi:DNA polymerase I-like protein with 3'-5' exonuclease and polymerase domains